MDKRERARQLIHRYLDGIATGAELDELDALVRTHDDVADLFVELSAHETLLADRFRVESKASAERPPRTVLPTRRLWTRYVVPAALAASLVVAVFVVRGTRWATKWAAEPSALDIVAITSSLHLPIAEIVGFSGRVRIADAASNLRLPAAGLTVPPGTWIATGPKGSLRLRYPDGTLISIEGEARLALDADGDTKRLRLHEGVVYAYVQPQAAEPMIFTTSHARAQVDGTRLTLAAGPKTTLVHAGRGAVKAEGLGTGARVEVRGGDVVVIGASQENGMQVQTKEANVKKLAGLVVMGTLLAAQAAPAAESVELARRNLAWSGATLDRIEADLRSLAGGASDEMVRATLEGLRKTLREQEQALGEESPGEAVDQVLRFGRVVTEVSQAVLDRAQDIGRKREELRILAQETSGLTFEEAPEEVLSRMVEASLQATVARLREGRLEARKADGRFAFEDRRLQHIVDAAWQDNEYRKVRDELARRIEDGAARDRGLRQFDEARAAARKARRARQQQELEVLKLEQEREILALQRGLGEERVHRLHEEEDRARESLDRAVDEALSAAGEGR